MKRKVYESFEEFLYHSVFLVSKKRGETFEDWLVEMDPKELVYQGSRFGREFCKSVFSRDDVNEVLDRFHVSGGFYGKPLLVDALCEMLGVV